MEILFNEWHNTGKLRETYTLNPTHTYMCRNRTYPDSCRKHLLKNVRLTSSHTCPKHVSHRLPARLCVAALACTWTGDHKEERRLSMVKTAQRGQVQQQHLQRGHRLGEGVCGLWGCRRSFTPHTGRLQIAFNSSNARANSGDFQLPLVAR